MSKVRWKKSVGSVFFILIVLFSFASVAHEEELEVEGLIQDTLSIKGYGVVFVRPEKLSVNQELSFAMHVRDVSGKFVSGLDVQGQIMDEQGKDIFFAKTREVSVGHYSFSWKQSFAGTYFVQFIFRSSEDEVIKPTFKISVYDPRAAYILWGSIIAALLSVLGGLYCAFSRKGKRKVFRLLSLLEGVGFGVLIVLLGYSVSYFYQSGGEKGFVVCGNEGCELAVHWHSQLEMSACGKPFHLPLESGDLNKQHTHKERDRLHVHATLKTDKTGTRILEPEKLVVGQLFDFLKIRFTNTCFDEYCNGDVCSGGKKGVLKMMVNNVPHEEYNTYVWKDGDRIQIVFE